MRTMEWEARLIEWIQKPLGSMNSTVGTTGAFLVRSARYAVIIFVIIGVYPKAFSMFEKAGRRETKDRQRA